MDTIDAIRSRRSIRTFDPGRAMAAGDEERLLSAAALAPSAFNLQHWRFVVIKDAALRAEIRAAAWDQSQITDASLLVLLCADLAVWRKDARRVWAGVDDAIRDRMAGMIDGFYSGREWLQRDDAMRSLGMAAQNLMLAAKAMGYESCPMDGFDADAVARLVNLPADHAVGLFVAVGAPPAGVGAPPHPGRLTLAELTVTDRFSSAA